MIDFIKSLHRNRVIKKLQSTPRIKKIDNIEEVHTIAVICCLEGEHEWMVMQHFAKVMEGHGKKVNIIALLPKDHELSFVVTHKGTTIVRAKSDFNFWGLPSNEALAPFTENSYDLLIDTIGEDNFFSKYVALCTTASLKVAYATPTEDPTEVFDFVIRGDSRLELKDFINNVIEYLGMIKK